MKFAQVHSARFDRRGSLPALAFYSVPLEGRMISASTAWLFLGTLLGSFSRRHLHCSLCICGLRICSLRALLALAGFARAGLARTGKSRYHRAHGGPNLLGHFG